MPQMPPMATPNAAQARKARILGAKAVSETQHRIKRDIEREDGPAAETVGEPAENEGADRPQARVMVEAKVTARDGDPNCLAMSGKTKVRRKKSYASNVQARSSPPRRGFGGWSSL